MYTNIFSCIIMQVTVHVHGRPEIVIHFVSECLRMTLNLSYLMVLPVIEIYEIKLMRVPWDTQVFMIASPK